MRLRKQKGMSILVKFKTTIMPLQEEIIENKRKISSDGYPMSIGELISLYKENEIDIHPEFQRFFRWTLFQKSKLIESILLGIPLPSIFVSQREDGVWDVVDGLQRLSTIFEFIGILKKENGELYPPSKLEKTQYLPSLEGKQWDNLDNPENSLDHSQRLAFKREKIDVKIVKKESDDNIKYELFQRLNTLGSKLSDQEVRNCLLILVNRDFYQWLKELSDDEHFLSTISIADRLISEQYNMELALRYIIFNTINLADFRGITDFSEFITEKMKFLAQDPDFNRDIIGEKFKNTFKLLDKTLSENSFKKYSEVKHRFEGKFLVAAYEAIAIGIGKNIEAWLPLENNDNIEEVIKNKVIEIWRHETFQDKSGSGVNVTQRVPHIIPLGERILRP